MASKKQPYEYKHISLVMGARAHDKKLVRLTQRDGWEVVEKSKVGAFGSRYAFTLRRPNPKYVGPADVAEPGIEDAR